MKKILITGSSGFIGTSLIEQLKNHNDRNNYKIYCLYNSNKPIKYEEFFYLKTNLNSFSEVKKIVSKIKPDIIIHLAWFVKHEEFWTSLENYTNFSFTINLLKCFKENGGSFFWSAGTFMEYSYNSSNKNNYIFTKLQICKVIQGFCRLNNISYGWGSIFSIFGELEPKAKLVSYLIENLKRKEKVFIKNPYNKFDYIHKNDVAKQIIHAITNELKGCYDIGTGISTSLYEIALIIADIMQVNKNLIVINKKDSKKESIVAKPLLNYNQDYLYYILKKIIHSNNV